MSLVTTARCSRGDYDEESCDSAATKLSAPERLGVMVTTTIERQSTPIGRGVYADGGYSEADGEDMFSGNLNRSRGSATWASSYTGAQKVGSRGSVFSNA